MTTLTAVVTTTPPVPVTTPTAPVDCIFELTSDELKEGVVTFESGVTAELTPEGEVVYTFPEPRIFTSVVTQVLK